MRGPQNDIRLIIVQLLFLTFRLTIKTSHPLEGFTLLISHRSSYVTVGSQERAIGIIRPLARRRSAAFVCGIQQQQQQAVSHRGLCRLAIFMLMVYPSFSLSRYVSFVRQNVPYSNLGMRVLSTCL